MTLFFACPRSHVCTEDPDYNDTVCYQRFCCLIEFAVIKKYDMDLSKAWITASFEQFLGIIRFVYLLESPRRGDANKYTKRMFSWRITWEYQ